jgi:hypothetical protein
MTLQEAKSIAHRLGLTLRMVRSGDYRVNFRDGNETTAYYTDNLEDAVNTAVEMARILLRGQAFDVRTKSYHARRVRPSIGERHARRARSLGRTRGSAHGQANQTGLPPRSRVLLGTRPYESREARFRPCSFLRPLLHITGGTSRGRLAGTHSQVRGLDRARGRARRVPRLRQR